MNNHPATALRAPTDIAALVSHPRGSTLRYSGVPHSAGALVLAVLVALALHAAMLLAFNRHQHVVRIAPLKAPVEIVEWKPVADEPPEPPKPGELSEEPAAVAVPSLIDIPVLVTVDTVFIQKLDPTVPLKLDPNGGKLATIPANYRRGPVDNMGTTGVFTPSELDRVPEAIAQTNPDYPFELKRLGVSGRVRVGFIVDSRGNVVSPYVISSTDKGFERATLDALLKWKFRPGMKNGRKVNTRIEQPIDFNLAL